MDRDAKDAEKPAQSFGDKLLERARSARLISLKKGFRLVALTS